MDNIRKLTLTDLKQRLASPSEGQPGEGIDEFAQDSIGPASGHLLEAACVLTFFEPADIKPVGARDMKPDERKEDLQRLIGCSEVVFRASKTKTASGGAQTKSEDIQYQVKEDVRIPVLKKLFEQNRVIAALDANREQAYDKDNVLQLALTNALTGKVRHLEDLDLEHLNALLRISEWLDFNVKGKPLLVKQEIIRQIQLSEILHSFKHLTGRYEDGYFVEQFRGRKDELERLRQYVGVAAPQSSIEKIKRVVSDTFTSDKKAPMLISGLGGVGKSSLLAKFLLEHAEAQQVHRFPFVYLDFDRPNLSASEPDTLLIEAVRQLKIQYSNVPHFAGMAEEFYNRWKQKFSTILDESQTLKVRIKSDERGKEQFTDSKNIRRNFIELVNVLSKSETKPFLMVLDTFEEVQYKGKALVEELYHFLMELQQQYRLLRIVFAGRAPIADLPTETLVLKELDLEASEGYLMKVGGLSARDAKAVAKKFGGNPLTLKLAAEVVKAEGLKTTENLKTAAKKFLLIEERLSHQQIQAILYERILGHVHDQRILKLAHPGLVLRFITAELIFQVLAEPCGLKLDSRETANELFEELAKEVSLVSRIDTQTLKHRADVRQVMLKLIGQSKPEVVRVIHARAVSYYKQRNSVQDRAEEIYHLLAMGESPRKIESRWLEGVQKYLTASREELPPKAQAYLAAKTGIENIDPEIWDAADMEDVERRMVRNVAGLLNSGNAERALKELQTYYKTTSKNPVLTLFEVKAHLYQSNYRDAVKVASKFLKSDMADKDEKVKDELKMYVENYDKKSWSKSSPKTQSDDELFTPPLILRKPPDFGSSEYNL